MQLACDIFGSEIHNQLPSAMLLTDIQQPAAKNGTFLL